MKKHKDHQGGEWAVFCQLYHYTNHIFINAALKIIAVKYLVFL